MSRAAFVTLAVLVALSSPLVAQPGALTSQGSGRATKPPVTATVVSTEVVNLNNATAAQIASLPGIGPKTADLVVQYRTKNGPFKKIEEIMNVRGIGEKSFLKIKDRLTVSDGKK
jgi:competence protein ComEA